MALPLPLPLPQRLQPVTPRVRLREVERYQRLAEQLAISPPELAISPISPPEIAISPPEIAPGIARRARTPRRARPARRARSADQVLLAHLVRGRVRVRVKDRGRPNADPSPVLLAHCFGDRVYGVTVVLGGVRG